MPLAAVAVMDTLLIAAPLPLARPMLTPTCAATPGSHAGPPRRAAAVASQ
jgi:hypothetical protein